MKENSLSIGVTIVQFGAKERVTSQGVKEFSWYLSQGVKELRELIIGVKEQKNSSKE